MNDIDLHTTQRVDAHSAAPGVVVRDDDVTRLVRISGPGRSGGSLLAKGISGPAHDFKRICLQRDLEIASRFQLSCALPFEGREGRGDDAVLLFGDPGVRVLEAGRPVGISRWIALATEMVRALDEIHQAGLLHRDIALDNFLSADEKLYIADFSHAHQAVREFIDFEPLDSATRRLRYMAPEASGRFNRPADHRADYYSLGVVLYELLTGRVPFRSNDAHELIYLHMTAPAPSPREAIPDLPEAISAIVQRLLAKEPDRRYQHAQGLLAHLREAARQPGRAPALAPRGIAAGATAAALDTPVRIYGREADRRILLERLELACAHQPQLLLIGGASGIGKTALIRETYLPVTRHRAFFVAGKFDQVRQGTPYSAWAHAMDRLVRFVLSEPADELARWRSRFTESLGSMANVLAPMVPSLPRLLEQLPPAMALPASEARERLYDAWARFLSVFHDFERPVVVFLDDLQWIDSASLELLDWLVRRPLPLPLLLIGAYRDNEVSRTHPLTVTLQTLGDDLRFSLTQLTLAPLGESDVAQLLAEAMHRPPGQVSSLAAEVWHRTSGNPFFVWQFLRTLCERGYITFDREQEHWDWDLPAIRAAGYPDEVVDLMLQRFHALPRETRELLGWAACVGGRFDLFMLSALADVGPQEGHRRLRPALDEEFIVPAGAAQLVGQQVLPTRYAFFHDHMQAAAYKSIDTAARAPLHYRIVTLLRARWGERERAAGILEIASHLNRARELLLSEAARLDLAQVNLEAARHAKASGAFEAAVQYLRVGMADVPADIWEKAPDLAFALFRERGELEYLNSAFDTAESFVQAAIAHVDDPYRQGDLYHMLVVQYTLRANYRRAIATARHGLALFGERLPDAAYEQARDAELARVRQLLGERSLAALSDLEPMHDRHARAVMQLLAAVGPPSYRSHPRLWSIVVARQMRLCLEHGTVEEGTYCFPAFGGLLTHVERGDGSDCAALYDATQDLMKRCDDPAAVPVGHLMMASSLRHWFSPMAMASQDYLAAYRAGQASGNLQYAVYGFGHNTYCRYFQGTPLDELIPEVLGYLKYSEQRQNQWGIDLISGALRVFELLHGDWKEETWSYHGEPEDAFRERVERHANVQVACIYHIMRASALLVTGDALAAAHSVGEAEARLDSVSAQGLLPTTQFYILKALAMAQAPERFGVDADGVGRYLAETVSRYERWQRHAPSNFGYWHHLALAEQARHLGDPVALSRAYDRALRGAQEQGCWLAAALIARRAEQYWRQQGLDTFAHIHRQQADAALRQGRAWRAAAGAGGESGPTLPERLGAAEQMDAAIAIARTLAQHTESEQLVPEIVALAARHAWAERVALLVVRDGSLRLAVEYDRHQHHHYPSQPELASLETLPRAVIEQVSTSGRALRFTAREVGGTPLLSRDAYLQARTGGADRPPGMFWCLPIRYPGRKLGVLYLELSHAGHHDTALVEFLAAQAAICMRNVELMDELHEQAHALREAQLRASRADTEIAVRRGSERHLRQLSETDELTGLANRRRFSEHLQQTWVRTPERNDEDGVTVMMIDIDHFKRVNDRYGHAAGDAILVHLAGLFRDVTRLSDVAARVGGEEFALLLHNVNETQAEAIAERLCETVRKTPARFADRVIDFTISIGLAVRCHDDGDCQALVQRADAALYRAKTLGRDRTSW